MLLFQELEAGGQHPVEDYSRLLPDLAEQELNNQGQMHCSRNCRGTNKFSTQPVQSSLVG